MLIFGNIEIFFKKLHQIIFARMKCKKKKYLKQNFRQVSNSQHFGYWSTSVATKLSSLLKINQVLIKLLLINVADVLYYFILYFPDYPKDIL